MNTTDTHVRRERCPACGHWFKIVTEYRGLHHTFQAIPEHAVDDNPPLGVLKQFCRGSYFEVPAQ